MRISDWSSDVCSSDLIHEKVSWILNKLAQRQARQEQLAIADTQWRNGGHVPYMGKRIYLDLGNPGSRITLDGNTVAPQDGDTMRMSLLDDADRHRVRDSVHGWLKGSEERRVGKECVRRVAPGGRGLIKKKK